MLTVKRPDNGQKADIVAHAPGMVCLRTYDTVSRATRWYTLQDVQSNCTCGGNATSGLREWDAVHRPPAAGVRAGSRDASGLARGDQLHEGREAGAADVMGRRAKSSVMSIKLLPAVAGKKPKLLDLYCGAGGACGIPDKSGYSKYFDVTGIDIVPRPTYPGRFVQADALDYVAQYGWMYDAIHASPPCEGYSHLTPKKYRGNHMDMIAPTRYFLETLGKPYVIENVSNARHLLRNPIMLCGSMFGLSVWRHRFFETYPQITFASFTCCHDFQPVPVNSSCAQRTARKSESIEAMQITWDMTREEVRKALPPAYGEWLGQRLFAAVRAAKDIGQPVSLLALAA